MAAGPLPEPHKLAAAGLACSPVQAVERLAALSAAGLTAPGFVVQFVAARLAVPKEVLDAASACCTERQYPQERRCPKPRTSADDRCWVRRFAQTTSDPPARLQQKLQPASTRPLTAVYTSRRCSDPATLAYTIDIEAFMYEFRYMQRRGQRATYPLVY